MAIEYTLICDGCGTVIARSRYSAKAARADGQLHRGGYCGDGHDWCGGCRFERTRTPPGGAQLGHSIGTRR